MKSTIVDEVGVEMAGPDDPALVRSMATEVRGASVGAVAPEQAGLVGAGVRGYVQITDDMVRRAAQAGEIDTERARQILTAALQPR